MRALSEKRLSDYMAQQIADEILSGRIVGGTQLKQEELAEVFGASRIPIREAFQVLEGQGLIVRLATRRIYAVELSEEQIQIIYEMIGDILKKAVENLKNEDKGKEVITILSSDLSTSKRFDVDKSEERIVITSFPLSSFFKFSTAFLRISPIIS